MSISENKSQSTLKEVDTVITPGPRWERAASVNKFFRSICHGIHIWKVGMKQLPGQLENLNDMLPIFSKELVSE